MKDEGCEYVSSIENAQAEILLRILDLVKFQLLPFVEHGYSNLFLEIFFDQKGSFNFHETLVKIVIRAHF